MPSRGLQAPGDGTAPGEFCGMVLKVYEAFRRGHEAFRRNASQAQRQSPAEGLINRSVMR